MERAGLLGRGSRDVQEGIQGDVERLVSAEQMGTVCKVMWICNFLNE